MLVLTLGDPYSVNVELLDQALRAANSSNNYPTVIIGSAQQLNFQLQQLSLEPWPYPVVSSSDFDPQQTEGIVIVDLGQEDEHSNPQNWPVEKRGQLALDCLRFVEKFSGEKRLAVVTGPVNKFALGKVGFGFPGQTEFFADLWKGDSLMLLAGPRLRVGLVTTHIPLRDVANVVKADLVLRQLAKLTKGISDVYGIKKPKIGVLGINPHAGEQGAIGNEDEPVVGVACREFNKIMGRKCAVGPLPADTAFYAAMNGKYDAILAMYHDQGLAPLKTVHFDDAINITVGLKHLRVSPDHGPAKDLFLKGKASPRSMAAALDFARAYLDRVC